MILFRCDAGSDVGYGHFKRCLALAGFYRDLGFDVTFLMENPPGAVQVLAGNHQVSVLGRGSSAACMGCLEENHDRIQLLVIDHYGIGIEDEARLFERFPILVIDDLCRPHHCHLLVDQTVGREASEYMPLMGYPDTRILAGSPYILLDPAYHDVRTQGSPTEIILSFGATDPEKYTLAVLELLEQLPEAADLTFHVPLSSLSPCLAPLESYACKSRCTIQVYKDLDNLVDLYRRCGTAIGAPGISILERVHCGLVNIAVQVADNQARVGQALGDLGAVAFMGDINDLEDSVFLITVSKVITSISFRTRLQEKAQGLIDAQGARRVVRQTADLLSGVTLRHADASDRDRLFQWQHRRGVRKYFRNPSPPAREEHLAWFERYLAGKGSILWIIQWCGMAVGYLRMDAQGDERELSILVDAPYQGLGFGKAALMEMLSKRAGRYRAEVHPGNQASIHLFRSAGFKLKSTDNTGLWQIFTY